MKMNLRKAIVCSLIGLGALTIPAAGANVIVEIEVAPPPARVEVVPPQRTGYVWAPGYWRWEGRRHVWIPGRWIKERPGHHWIADRWVNKNGRYYFEPGRWERRQAYREREDRRRERDRR
jgi:hypothetical protein